MGKSKHNKWFDDHEDNSTARKNDWEYRRQLKRSAWEAKQSSITTYEPKDEEQRG